MSSRLQSAPHCDVDADRASLERQRSAAGAAVRFSDGDMGVSRSVNSLHFGNLPAE